MIDSSTSLGMALAELAAPGPDRAAVTCAVDAIARYPAEVALREDAGMVLRR